jgi:hypothetical protein
LWWVAIVYDPLGVLDPVIWIPAGETKAPRSESRITIS